jgi:hypothetical protein
VRGRDPLKNVVARAIPTRHFYLPALGRLRARFTAGRELAADRAARAAHGTAPLAGALQKVAEGPAWAGRRVGRRDEHQRPAGGPHHPARNRCRAAPPPAGRTAVLQVAATVALLATAVAWSAVIVAHYMPMCLPL